MSYSNSSNAKIKMKQCIFFGKRRQQASYRMYMYVMHDDIVMGKVCNPDHPTQVEIHT